MIYFEEKKTEIEECKLKEHFSNNFILAKIYCPKLEIYERCREHTGI